jgi:hypothetical protein
MTRVVDRLSCLSDRVQVFDQVGGEIFKGLLQRAQARRHQVVRQQGRHCHAQTHRREVQGV